jgi:hypothetical protein
MYIVVVILQGEMWGELWVLVVVAIMLIYTPQNFDKSILSKRAERDLR